MSRKPANQTKAEAGTPVRTSTVLVFIVRCKSPAMPIPGRLDSTGSGFGFGLAGDRVREMGQHQGRRSCCGRRVLDVEAGSVGRL